MAEKLATADLLGIDIDRVDDAAQYAVGSRVIDSAGNTREYCRAGAVLALGDALKIDTAEFTAATNDMTPTTASPDPVHGVAPAAIADNGFFWMITAPAKFVAVKAATVVAGTTLVTTGTSGTLDDTAATAAIAQGAAGGVGVFALGADNTLGVGAGFAPARLA